MRALRAFRSAIEIDELTRLFCSVRANTGALTVNLTDADATVQSMPDASPAKWHLAHTSWFFETMVLLPHLPGYQVYDERYNFLFNSYYETIGARHPRSARGLLTRPTLETINQYREHVDAGIAQVLRGRPAQSITDLIELGCQHEQQHQELLLTDILHLFAQNPLLPTFKSPEPLPVKHHPVAPPNFVDFSGGLIEIGHGGEGFAFDCETPRHSVFLEPYKIADRLVNNREWLEFMEDGGYENPLLWLSDGWAARRAGNWQMPLYWELRGREYWSMTLRGVQPLDLDGPVTHVSHYEADAYATWMGMRLPTEAEWEHAAASVPVAGNFAGAGRLRPGAPCSPAGLRQMYGDVWEWTRSAFTAYPNFHPTSGAVGEYNAKFMSGQFVLRGGSCVTPSGHIRASYRNFFPPQTRWQFSGVRLARDVANVRVSKTQDANDAFESDVLLGLSKIQKTLPSRWLYDERGSALFEEITQLEEYYPTRTETQILRDNAIDIAHFCGENASILEYGAGAAIKTELLIGALRNPRFYLPVDIANTFLDKTVTRLRSYFPDLATRPIVADFNTDFELPRWLPLPHRLAFFPGSTIGNLDETEVLSYLRRIRGHVGPTGKAVIGLDLRKSVQVLIPAYDDAKGVTAQFNLNLLTRINRELHANFELGRFKHQVKWSESHSAIEMHLLSLQAQRVEVAGRAFHFSAGETIHTESSRKYDLDAFSNVCERCGWRVDRVWIDSQKRFAVFGLI
jgi:dimethylhistidine N-methyltransferase